VFIPKKRRKELFGKLRTRVGSIIRDLAKQKECNILEGHTLPDHVHMLISIPPKHAVAQIVGFIKGKSALAILRMFLGRERNFTGEHFWARGYFVSTVGFEEDQVKKYIQEQEGDDGNPDTKGSF
jgi:putative transposase